MKKYRGMLLLLAAACFLTSCKGAGDASGQDKKVTLTVMGKKSDLQKSYMTSIFEQYQTATGNKLEILSFEDAGFETEAAQRFEDGKVPDVFMHFHNADLNRFAVADHFYYLNEESWVNDLADSASAYCRDREGNLLGLPFWENSVSGCYYNKTILDSLGLKPATTQAEFDMLCQALADSGYTPICWPADGCSWMFQFGLDPIFADQPSLLEQLNQNEISYQEIPEVAAMVQWIADAASKGWFGADYLETGWDDISTSLGEGKAVMTFIWDTWFSTDFAGDGKYGLDDFALMPIFMNTADGGTYEGGNLNMMMINKNSEHLEEAREFLAFCASEENYNVAFEGIATLGCFKGQTTNISSQMVTDAQDSLVQKERVSTAASKIVGYSADDVLLAVNDLLRGKTDVAGCVQKMDEERIKEEAEQATEAL